MILGTRRIEENAGEATYLSSMILFILLVLGARTIGENAGDATYISTIVLLILPWHIVIREPQWAAAGVTQHHSH